MSRTINNLIRGGWLLVVLLLAQVSISAGPVPAAAVAALQAAGEKAKGTKPGSAEQRRACKRVVRSGKSLIAEHPDAPNRFELLGLMLQNQKVVLKLEPSDRNRDLLYRICSQMVQAPDVWAKVRLEADLLLSERELSARGASLEERAEALLALIEHYRGTTAEPKSLMIGAVIAQDLESGELLRHIEQMMDERCAGVPELIAFRRNVLNLKSLRVKCQGRYRRSDGMMLHIPGDRIGHQCLLVYWSQEHASTERFIQEVKAQQTLFPGAFEVYSFNLDELPDAGETLLRHMGLDWHAMHLPDGKRNVFYQAYGAAHPAALFVNSFGYTVLNPFGVNPDTQGWRSIDSGIFKISGARISHDRYLAQLQSLVIGDFLVGDAIAPFDPALPQELKTAGEVWSAVTESPLWNGAERDAGQGRGVKHVAGETLTRSALAESGDSVTALQNAASVPTELFNAIQSCFVPPPLRYRLTREEALANYRKAEKLCSETLKQHANAPRLWAVRNRRIVALLGLWNLACDPAYLEQAVQEATSVLAADVPSAEAVVARFCIAKASLREEGPHPEGVVQKMLEASGGDEAPVSSVAAAAILALEANSRELHEEYRARVLAFPMNSTHPMWGVRSFLLNRYHRFYLLRPNTTRGDRMGWTRGHIVNHGWNTNAVPFPELELKELDGTVLNMPADIEGRLTLLLFIEPPPASEADYPVVQGKKGFVPKDVYQERDYVRGVVESAMDLAEKHISQGVDVRLAFLSDDAQRVQRLMQTNAWDCAAALVPGGLSNPVVRQLDILSADRLPNVFLLRRDGTVAWNCSGLVYKSEFGFPFAITLAMKVHIEICDVQHGYRALVAGDYALAARTFAGPFLPSRPDRYGWRAPRHHGGALAHAALEDWGAALESIDKAIDARKLRYYQGRRSKAIEDWRKDAATVTVKQPDGILNELWATKALILDALGRKAEATVVRKRSQEPALEVRMSIYEEFHEKLKAWRTECLSQTP